MKRFLVLAAAFPVALALLHLLGGRERLCILSGTPADPPILGPVLGLLYLVASFCAVVLSPVLVLAAPIYGVLTRRPRETNDAINPAAAP